jgi:hypothetical protein
MKYAAGIGIVSVVAGIMFFNCSPKRIDEAHLFCIIGKDTLTMHRIVQLVPDSMADGSRTMRALFELMCANQAAGPNAKTGGSPYTAPSKQLIDDLARQLSLQSADAWTPDAAQKLYYAGKFIQSLASERTMAAVFTRLDKIFLETVVNSDTATLREITARKDSIFATLRPLPWTGRTEDLLRLLLMLPPQSAKVVEEFLNSSETITDKGPQAQTMIQGLLASGKEAKKPQTALRTSAPPKANSGEVLRYRSKQSIKDSIARHIPDLEALYKKHLKVHQAMAGTVWVTFQISAAGNVLSAQLKTSTIGEKDFLVPLQDYLIEKVRFKPIPENLGAMAFEFPFDFSSEN